MKLKITIILLSAAVLLSTPLHSWADENPIIFIGYGRYGMFPFLDGAVLEVRSGEAIYMRVLNGKTEVTLTTPSGVIDKIINVNNMLMMVKNFTNQDEKGDWVLETNNMKMILKHVEPSGEIQAELTTRLENDTTVVAEIKGLNKSYALFITQEAEIPLLNPGKELRIRLEEPVLYAYIVELIDAKREVDIEGKIKTTAYTLSSDGIIGRWVLHPVKINGTWFLRLTIPSLNEVGERGVIPLSYGSKILKIYGLLGGKLNKILETETIVAPPNIGVKYFTNKIYVDVSAINTTIVEAILGAENGEFKRIKIKLPLASVQVLSHKQQPLNNVRITMPNSIIKKIDNDRFLIVYLHKYTIDGATAPELLELTREDRPIISSRNIQIKEYDPKPITFNPGKNIKIIARVHNLTIKIVDVRGNLFKRNAEISVDGNKVVVENGVTVLTLNSGEHVVYSLSPQGLEKYEINLKQDMEITITIIDNLNQIIGLGILFILQVILFVFILRRI
ncbi:MAG TPA: hypothetical protein EYH45_04405 [Candidatus Caldiarchaeum subterraneum]|uniref:Uncharacterized protein n=1 Tax=Caldiarchaeum subterraneum TaxID=311458 RepID=A0A832ZW24_CALS0|nr:hypothetical protein [Candidatus Caldarchaeum subterraneum]